MGSGIAERRAARSAAHRAAAFERGLDAWRVEAAELDQLQDVAAVFQGRTRGSAGTAFVLEPDEAVFLFLPRVHLAATRGESRPTSRPRTSEPGFLMRDARRIAACAPGTFTEPRGLRLVSSGTLTVTDRRIVFDTASGPRSWMFADLAAVEHHADQPCSVLTVTDQGDDPSPAVALVYPAATTVHLRFHLTLVSSRFGITGDLLTAELDSALLAQWLTEPMALPTEPAAKPAKRKRSVAASS